MAWWTAARTDSLWLQIFVTFAIITPLGPIVYRLAFQPLANASVLVLLIIAVAVHYVLTGLGLVFFGGEGLRSGRSWTLTFPARRPQHHGAEPLDRGREPRADRGACGSFSSARCTARRCARPRSTASARGWSAFPPDFSGQLSFLLAAFIGAVSGILISPITTIYYDTGFLISLKGFVGAILGGMASYPLAAVGSLVVGFLESFSSFWASAFKESIVFTLIIPVLLWRSLTSPHHDEDEEQ